MNRKLLISIILPLIVAVSVSAQQSSIERDFEKKRASYTLKRFHEDRAMFPGETTTRYEYLYYLDKDQLVKIRFIERRNEPDASIKVDDYFLVDGDLRLVQLYFFIDSTRLAIIKAGRVVDLPSIGERIELADGKLLKWAALGKVIPSTDKRWRDKQQSVLISLKVEMMIYKEFTKPKE
jgi:hypothetical protein